MANSELAKEIKALGYLFMFAFTHILSLALRRCPRLHDKVKRITNKILNEEPENDSISQLLKSAGNPFDRLDSLIGSDVIVISRHHERDCAARLVSYRRTPDGRYAITYIDYTTRGRDVICQDIVYFTVTPYSEELLISFKSIPHEERHTRAPTSSSVNWEDLNANGAGAVKRTRVSPCSLYESNASIDEVITVMQRRADASQSRSIPHK